MNAHERAAARHRGPDQDWHDEARRSARMLVGICLLTAGLAAWGLTALLVRMTLG